MAPVDLIEGSKTKSTDQVPIEANNGQKNLLLISSSPSDDTNKTLERGSINYNDQLNGSKETSQNLKKPDHDQKQLNLDSENTSTDYVSSSSISTSSLSPMSDVNTNSNR